MKKLRIALIAMVIALAAVGVAACTGEKKPASEHTVTFQIAGGGSIEPQTVKDGETAVKPADPERIGWTFNGWYLGDAEYTFTEKVTQDITLTARYTSVLGGEGTAASPFTIDTAEELELMSEYIEAGASEFVSANYIQTANIVSALGEPVKNFTGIYDGGNKTLSLIAPLFGTLGGTVKNLTVSGEITSDAENAGLIASIADGAVISDVSASGSVAASRGIAGGIAGVFGGRMEYVNSSVSVTGLIAGGIAGESNGAILNSVVTSNVSAERSAGGVAGVLGENALVQNCGFSGNVRAGESAGGVAGNKEAGSAIFRAFVFGKSKIEGETAGGIAGALGFDLMKYDDVFKCMVGTSVAVEGSKSETECDGVFNLDAFAALGLPAAVWDVGGETPALKAERDELPSQVTLSVNGEESSAPYGSHVQGELFDDDGLHFSVLFELDFNAELSTIEVSNEALQGVFAGGNSELEFTANGALYTESRATGTKTLTYTGSRVNYEKYYDSWWGEYVDYAAHVHAYTDGTTEYAFMIEKELIKEGEPDFIGYLYMFEKKDGKWALAKEWTPKTDIFAGSYVSTSQTTNLYLVVDGAYTVDTVENTEVGCYYTKFTVYVDGEISRTVNGRGITAMFYGSSANTNAYIPALVYAENNENSLDVVRYVDGELVSYAYSNFGSYVYSDFLAAGTWFDGEKTYVINTQDKTVALDGGAAVQYTLSEEDGSISFSASGVDYNLMLGLNAFGDYKLYSTDSAKQFVAVSYADGALAGTWLSGDTSITVGESSVTVNGEAATGVRNAVYNDALALRFVDSNNAEYFLVQYNDSVALLYKSGVRAFAVKEETLELYEGVFASFVNGRRAEITINADFTGSYKLGEEVWQITPRLIFNEGLGLVTVSFEANGTTYVIAFYNETTVVAVDVYSAEQWVFTTSEIISEFVVSTHTNGTQMLEITSSGTYAIYDRGESKGTFTALTASYLERYGFSLVVYDGENIDRFFTLDDAGNMFLYDGESGDVICSFVSDSAVQAAVGTYVSNNGFGEGLLVRTTLHADGRITETYTDKNGVKHENEERNWNPQIVFTDTAKTKTQLVLLIQDEATNMFVYYYKQPLGLSVFGEIIYFNEDIFEYMALSNAYKTPDGGVVQIAGASAVDYNGVRYSVTNIESTESGATISLEYPDWLSPVQGALTFAKADGNITATFTTGSDTLALTPVEIEELEEPVGTFRNGETIYTVDKFTNYSGETKLRLSFSEFIANGVKKYTLLHSGFRIADNGETLIAMSDVIAGTRYIRKDGDNLIVYSTLSEAAPKTATPVAAVNISKYAKTYKSDTKTAVIDVKSYDWGDTITLKITENENTATYNYSCSYYSGETYAMAFNTYDDDYNEVYIYVRVTENSDGSITISIGEQKDEQEGDERYTWENSIPLPPPPPPPPPLP